MTSNIHTPEGVRDITPSEFEKKRDIENRLLDVMKSDGYRLMQTPSFEYFDVFANNIGMTPSRELYKFFDKEGNTLVLRPDFTPAMARAFSKLYFDEMSPVRLCYCGNTFVNGSDLNGRYKEITQIGAEFYNDGSANADAGMISLAISCMKAAGFNDFIVSIGNANFFRGLCEMLGISDENELVIRELISARSYYKAEEILTQQNIDKEYIDLIVHISDRYTTRDSLTDLRKKMGNKKCKDAIDRLISIFDILEDDGFGKYISIDLGLLNKYNYYTGVLFRAYTYGFGDALIKGGRYDNLVKEFGKDTTAIGFGISVDELLIALREQEESGNDRSGEYLTIALTKGRLADKTLALLEKTGITCEEMKDKETRKLIFVNEDLKLRFFPCKRT